VTVNRHHSLLYRQTDPLKRAVAALGVALVLLLGVLEVFPAAHEWFHGDAEQPDHACAVTLFAHGVAPVLAAVMLAVVAWRLLERLVEWSEVLVLPPAFAHLPGRAPPVR